jgi:hypothetical protein
MIEVQDAKVDVLVTRLARTLSPQGKDRRNDIARNWIFEGSSWVAEEVYEGEKKTPVGLRLTSPDYDNNTIYYIEFALATLLGQKRLVDDCVQVDRQPWTEWLPPDGYDCGYETTYQLKHATLKITIRHRRTNRSTKSQAIARVRQSGSLSWKNVCDLKGDRVRSREETQFREQTDYRGVANARLFEDDERELFGMAIGILQA